MRAREEDKTGKQGITSPDDTLPSVPTRRRKTPSRKLSFQDVAGILSELHQGHKANTICKRFSVSTQYVNRVKTYWLELKEQDQAAQSHALDVVKKRSEDGFIRSVDRIQRSITTGDIFRASLKDKVWAIGVLYDKHRLATGQSTSNVKTLAMIVERMDQGRRYGDAQGPRPEPIPAEATVHDTVTHDAATGAEPLI